MVRPVLAPDLFGKGGERQQINSSGVEAGCDLEQLLGQRVDDPIILSTTTSAQYRSATRHSRVRTHDNDAYWWLATTRVGRSDRRIPLAINRIHDCREDCLRGLVLGLRPVGSREWGHRVRLLGTPEAASNSATTVSAPPHRRWQTPAPATPRPPYRPAECAGAVPQNPAPPRHAGACPTGWSSPRPPAGPASCAPRR